MSRERSINTGGPDCHQVQAEQLLYNMARQSGMAIEQADSLASLLGAELYAFAALLLMKGSKP